MAKLDNSTRRLPQAVYAQVKLDRKDRPFRPARPLLKASLVTSMRPSQDETNEIKRHLIGVRDEPGSDPAAIASVFAAIAAIEAVAFSRGRPDPARFAQAFAPIDGAALADFCRRLLSLRDARTATLVDIHARLLASHAATPSGGPAAPRLVEAAVDVHTPARLQVPGSATVGSDGGVPAGTGRTLARSASTLIPRPVAMAVTTLADLLTWGAGNGWQPEELERLRAGTQALGYVPTLLKAGDFPLAAESHMSAAAGQVASFEKQLAIEPVGFLHLERMTFAPDGIERGELVYSVPLTPAEEIDISHKEWSTTSEEFSTIVTDSLDEYSEQGVAEKSELAQSTTSQQQHSNGFNTGVTASGGYGPVSVTATASMTIAASASETAVFSRNQSIATTRKASARAKKEHKVSFKVNTASGTSDQSVRRIKNPFPDKAARVDYYQLIRKWEVKVFRYGIRLTYDMTIPEPGSDVLTKIVAINALQAALQDGFGPSATQAWARFDLTPGQLTPANYAQLAAQYIATVPAPPVAYQWYDVSAQHQWKTYPEAERNQFFTIGVTVDEQYEIDHVDVDPDYTIYKGEPSYFNHQSVADFYGTSGNRILVYQAYGLGSLTVELRVGAKLRQAAVQAWQLKAWSAIRDAAQARYYEQRSLLKEQVARLQDEMGAQDALSLRKFEREEVMKGVLRWMFGPDFDFVPPGLPADLYAQDQALASMDWWKQMQGQGELIKFLHQAIEWENLLYFLYPYFWSHYSRWEMKKFLDHPDVMHRAFLKAGSARVVLTIRPGFERDFVSFLETGKLDGLPGDDAYMTIIDEMEAYAKTNYPGIPPADPEGASKAEEGQMIATWHEYTPTSAIDLSFNETLPTA